MKKKEKEIKEIKEIKEFWDGPKVGFNEILYKKYLHKKKKWRTKMN